jgi:hypothetical protein
MEGSWAYPQTLDLAGKDLARTNTFVNYDRKKFYIIGPRSTTGES